MEENINNITYKFNSWKNKYGTVPDKNNTFPIVTKIAIILDSSIFVPPIAGLPHRVHYLTKHLVKKNIEVVWIIANRNFKTEEELKDIFSIQANIYILNENEFYGVEAIKKILLIEKVNLIQFEVVQTFLSVGLKIKNELNIPCVLEIHDIDSVLSKTIGSPTNIDSSYFLQKIAANLADSILVMSSIDHNFLTSNMKINKNKIFISPNGIDNESMLLVDVEKKFDIIFLGNMYYKPNLEGFNYFYNNVVPFLKTQNIKIDIIGIHGSELPDRYDKNIVTFIGPLTDDKKFLNHLASAKLAICPVLSGSGMKVKILNYAAAKLPIITTSIGSAGYENIQSLIVCDEEQLFASKVDELLQRTETSIEIGKENQNHVKNYYNWDIIIESVIDAYVFAINSVEAINTEIPAPFWLRENRDTTEVLKNSYLIKNNLIKKLEQ